MFFKSKSEIIIFSDKQNLKELATRRSSQQNKRNFFKLQETALNRNSDLPEGIKDARNCKYMDKYKRLPFLVSSFL